MRDAMWRFSLVDVCVRWSLHFSFLFFFFNDTATTEIYTLSLHDALPIYIAIAREWGPYVLIRAKLRRSLSKFCSNQKDRKSTRLNSSHLGISYAVFCLKKKKEP